MAGILNLLGILGTAVQKLLLPILLCCLVTSCAPTVDGQSDEAFSLSLREMTGELNATERQQLYTDTMTIATSMPATEAPFFMDGMTKEEIAGQAVIIRLKREIESGNARIENMKASQQRFNIEADLRDNAIAELANVRLSLQPVEEHGVIVGCTLLIANNSRHALQSVTWEISTLGRFGRSLTNFSPELPAGESRTLSDCGHGTGGGESIATSLIRAAEATPPVVLWGELPGNGPDLRPWDSPNERKTKVTFYGAVEDLELQVAEEKKKVLEAQRKLAGLQ